MPTFTFTAPTGETYDVQAPEGATQEQAFAMLQQQLAAPAPAAAEPAAPAEQSVGDRLLRQLGLTARAAGEGTAGLVGIFSDPIAAVLNQFLPEDRKARTLRSAVSSLLTEVGVPEPATATERIVQEAAQAVAGGGATIGAAKAVKAVTPVAKGAIEAIAAKPAEQLAGSAAAGAAAQGAEELGGGPAAQIAAALLGGAAGARVAGTRVVPAAGAAPGVVGEAEKRGVQVMTSDVRPPTTFAGRWLTSTAEKIPFAGTGGPRAEQQAQRVEAVRDTLRQYGAHEAAQASDNVMADLAAKRQKDLTRYASQKNEVIDRLAEKGVVPVNDAVAAINKHVAELQSLNTKEVEPIINRLVDFGEAVQGQSLRNVEELRKQLGEAFKAPELTAVRGRGEKAVADIYAGLREDMAKFIYSNGERRDYVKWAVANRRLSDMADDLKIGTLKSTLKRGEATPEVVNQMLFSAKPSDVRMLYRELTPEGRAHARAAIMYRAAEKAGGMEHISPDKFANEVERLGNSAGVFFTGSDAQEIQGLMRVLETTKRAGQAAVLPQTGVQVTIPVVAAVLTDLLGGAGAATATGLGAGLSARIYESPMVRNMLMKLPQTAKGSPEEAALFKRIAAAIQTQQGKEEK